jgi:hypothetical protein
MRSVTVALLLSSQLVWPQVETGSVVVGTFDQDEITIAADSRKTMLETGIHDDTECKISAFGNNFVFAVAGTAGSVGGWTAASVARTTWEAESKVASDTPLLDRVVDGWIKAMEKIYGDPELIAIVRRRITDVPVVATAAFAAMDKSGNLGLEGINILFDLNLFDTTKQVRLFHSVFAAPVGATIATGRNDVALEFRYKTTQRAKDYANWYETRVDNLALHQRRAEWVPNS